VEAVGYLHGLRCCPACAVGKRPTAIAAQHVDLRPAVLLQPAGERRGSAVGQQIDDAMLVEIDEDRAIVAAAAEGSGKGMELPPFPPLRTGHESYPFIRLKPLRSSVQAEPVNLV